jgi:hypothetical protein
MGARRSDFVPNFIVLYRGKESGKMLTIASMEPMLPGERQDLEDLGARPDRYRDRSLLQGSQLRRLLRG